MSRVRLHVPKSRLGPNVILEPEERRYLIDVHRLVNGAAVEIFDGEGAAFAGTLTEVDGRAALRIGTAVAVPATIRAVRLGVALLKGRKLDEVVRACTELGVAALACFVSERSVPRPDAGSQERRLQRWRQICKQAARQSGRASVPLVAPLVPFRELLEQAREPNRILLQEGTQDRHLPEMLRQGPSGAVLVLVGPEGGFSSGEVNLAQKKGFALARLGSTVLRSETAAVVAAAWACLDSEASSRVQL
jgi:16S rRNA (uracil1498-N3)-methyltransferase